MLTFMCRLGAVVVLAILSNSALAANGNPPSLYNSLARSAPELNPLYSKAP